ncbi:MAG TPA: hypothetical protein VK789_15960 [Bryobacteraceae bacterium]|nr:hypothetical protein [Bryobacteraceae bacterium]
MKIENPTRRELAIMAAASLAAAKATAQAPPAPNTDWYQAALQSHKQTSQTLAQFQIDMSVEPAFQFKA